MFLSRRARDEGFTLIEVIVAITLLGIVAAAVIPILVAGLRAATFAKTSTQAKNLTQLRLERMRDMPFHVDFQNGPYIDLLDSYFSAVSQTAFAEEPGVDDAGAVAGNHGHATGAYLATCPVALTVIPCFQVKILGVPGYPSFSQDVYTQFLKSDTSGITPPSTYANNSSAAVGADTPPSLLLGVTVVTGWKLGAATKSTSSYTQIADTRGQGSLLDVQARGAAVYVSGTAPDGTVVQGAAGLSEANGSQASGSTVSGLAEGAYVNEAAAGRIDGPCGSVATTCPGPPSATAPDPTNGVTAKYSGPGSGSGSSLGSSGCGRSHIGNTRAGVAPTGPDWGSVSGGLPAVPAGATPGSTASLLTGSLLATGGGGCSPFLYSNNTAGQSTDPVLALDGSQAPVSLSDVPGSGAIASAGTTLAATSDATTSHPVTSYAVTDLDGGTEIRLLPSTYVSDTVHGRAVMYLKLRGTGHLASLACNSTSAAIGSYHMSLFVWDGTSASYKQFNADYDSSSAAATSLPTLPATASWLVAPGVPLSTFLASGDTSWGFNTLQIDQTSGARSFGNVGAAFSVSTAPLFDSTIDPNRLSGLTISLGRLSCVADDLR